MKDSHLIQLICDMCGSELLCHSCDDEELSWSYTSCMYDIEMNFCPRCTEKILSFFKEEGEYKKEQGEVFEDDERAIEEKNGGCVKKWDNGVCKYANGAIKYTCRICNKSNVRYNIDDVLVKDKIAAFYDPNLGLDVYTCYECYLEVKRHIANAMTNNLRLMRNELKELRKMDNIKYYDK